MYIWVNIHKHVRIWWRHGDGKGTRAPLLTLCEGNLPIPLTKKVSNTKLWCFAWCQIEQAVEMVFEWREILDTLTPNLRP